jgi:hypothetical protein
MALDKIILQEIEEESGSVHQLIAETSDAIGGYTCLTFSTIWTGAKDPDLAQNKYRVHLTEEGLKKLKEFL